MSVWVWRVLWFALIICDGRLVQSDMQRKTCLDELNQSPFRFYCLEWNSKPLVKVHIEQHYITFLGFPRDMTTLMSDTEAENFLTTCAQFSF